ncbi:redox-sensing transcriptional repressor Rex [Treponema brennaborense]|uniref:Redox-sensing transcriptional repressor Rex n=1 Tax=Treponema brennaborense (strain DSM 12168 / CIP 105900 / DD5/3) TaxID=906968 RepID=F4LPN5_TREBD|nr:redox-sensing transcriptional repressor Rex [Treponema brennaborense]AEE17031.1 Redox-sensing transcriptional repressor rex [Treponema brennaborense DSM 12168]
MSKQKIPATPSIRRLPSYLHIIRQARNEGYEFISGTVIAQELHLEPIQVRKDLAITGIIGKPKRGYPVAPLITAIEHFLGWDTSKNAVLIGAGNLATALTGYQEFQYHGLNFVAAFDKSPAKIGTKIHGVPVFSIDTLPVQIRNLDATIAVLTVPSQNAQETADIIVAAGIKAIWNFTNVKLKLPEDIVCQREDLTSGYAMLCVMMDAVRPKPVKE